MTAGWKRAQSLKLLILVAALLPALGGRPRPFDVGRVWERFEAALPIAVEAANPFDPDQVDVWAEFDDGTQTVRIPGFVYQPFSSALVNGRESLSAQGELGWRVRFTPTRKGWWRWRWGRTTASGTEAGDWRRLRVASARADQHGFVRRSPDDERYLRFEDGSPFFSRGVNLGWHGARGTYDYEDWMAKYAAQGVNVIRVWMPRWTLSLFNEPAELRDWRNRMDRAWQLDRIFELAKQHDIRVMLVLLNHGAFSEDYNPGWHLNPFNADLGGPLEETTDVWSNPEGKEILHKLFRYVAARWGHSPNLLCWELWNEANLTAPAGFSGPDMLPMDEVVAWHREMTQTLHATDPNAHMVSTSSSDGVEAAFGEFMPPGTATFQPVWDMPEIDFGQLHLYMVSQKPFLPLYRATVTNRRSPAGGPALVAEAGVASAGPAETLAKDPEGEGFHDLLWAAIFAEAFGSGMPWWWDNLIDPLDRYFHWGPISALTRGVAFDREGFTGMDFPVTGVTPSVVAHTLAGQDTWLFWIKNQEHQYYSPDRSTLSGGELTLMGLPTGTWQGEWIDTWGGASPGPVVLVSGGPGDTIPLPVPDFSRDVALRLERMPAP